MWCKTDIACKALALDRHRLSVCIDLESPVQVSRSSKGLQILAYLFSASSEGEKIDSSLANRLARASYPADLTLLDSLALVGSHDTGVVFK
jgi:hypothetical protein